MRESLRRAVAVLALTAGVTGCASPDIEWKNDGSIWRRDESGRWHEVVPPPQLPPPPAGSSSWDSYSDSVGGETSNSTTPPPSGYSDWDAWNNNPSVSPPYPYGTWEGWMTDY